MLHSRNQLRAVASTYQQCLRARTDEAAFNAKRRPTLIALGVDDEHTAGTDDDVVDVGF